MPRHEVQIEIEQRDIRHSSGSSDLVSESIGEATVDRSLLQNATDITVQQDGEQIMALDIDIDERDDGKIDIEVRRNDRKQWSRLYTVPASETVPVRVDGLSEPALLCLVYDAGDR